MDLSNKSVFELNETGENRNLVENIQFQLDAMNTKNASMSLKKYSAFQLVSTCTLSRRIIPSLNLGIANTLMRVVGLLINESDLATRHCLHTLALTLIRNDDGAINPAVLLPPNVFVAILVSSLHMSFSKDILRDQQNCKHSGFSKKRKFAKAIPTSLITTGSDNDILVSNAQVLEIAASAWPVISAMTLPCNLKLASLFQSQREIGLLLLDRFLTSKVQEMPEFETESRPKASNNWSLQDYQSALRQTYNHATSTTDKLFGNSSFLDLILEDCCQDICKLHQSLDDHDKISSEAQLQSDRQLICSLWHLMNVLEAVVYKSAQNQIVIANKDLCLPSELCCLVTHEGKTSFISLCFSLMLKLCDICATESIVPSGKQQSSTVAVSLKCRTSRNDWQIDFDRTQKLFPELDYKCQTVVFESFKESNNESSQSQSQDSQLCSQEGDDNSSTQAPEVMQVLEVQLKNLCSGCLRVFVNVTNDCAAVCRGVSATGRIPHLLRVLSTLSSQHQAAKNTITEPPCSCVTGAVRPGCVSSDEDVQHVNSQRSQSQSAASQTSEIGRSKIRGSSRFDAILYVLTILTNLAEWDPQCVMAGDLITSASLSSLTKLPSVVTFAVNLILSCSKSFMDILEETDCKFQQDCNGGRGGGGDQVDEVLGLGVPAAAVARHDDSEPLLCVDDVIIAAHCCLFLTALTLPSSHSRHFSDEASPLAENTTCSSSQHHSRVLLSSTLLVCAVKQLLPRQSWWLPIRILKAFLAIQSKTQTMVLESVTPVLRSVYSMEVDDGILASNASETILHSEIESSVLNCAPAVSTGASQDSDWLDEILLK